MNYFLSFHFFLFALNNIQTSIHHVLGEKIFISCWGRISAFLSIRTKAGLCLIVLTRKVPGFNQTEQTFIHMIAVQWKIIICYYVQFHRMVENVPNIGSPRYIPLFKKVVITVNLLTFAPRKSVLGQIKSTCPLVVFCHLLKILWVFQKSNTLTQILQKCILGPLSHF